MQPLTWLSHSTDMNVLRTFFMCVQRKRLKGVICITGCKRSATAGLKRNWNNTLKEWTYLLFTPPEWVTWCGVPPRVTLRSPAVMQILSYGHFLCAHKGNAWKALTIITVCKRSAAYGRLRKKKLAWKAILLCCSAFQAVDVLRLFRRFRSAQPTVIIVAAFQADNVVSGICFSYPNKPNFFRLRLGSLG